jgi:hypothetical protein
VLAPDPLPASARENAANMCMQATLCQQSEVGGVYATLYQQCMDRLLMVLETQPTQPDSDRAIADLAKQTAACNGLTGCAWVDCVNAL